MVGYDSLGSPRVTVSWTFAGSVTTVQLIGRGNCGTGPPTCGIIPANADHISYTNGDTMFVDDQVAAGMQYRYQVIVGGIEANSVVNIFVGELTAASARIVAPATVMASTDAQTNTVTLRAQIGGTAAAVGSFGLTGVHSVPAGFDMAMVTLAGEDTAELSFEAPMLMAGDVSYSEIELTFTLAVTATGDADGASDMVTLVFAAGGGGDGGEAILPGVIGNINRGINSSIYRRIQQRQKEDGYWK